MSAQNSAGIQTLLDSEKEAQKIVQKGQPGNVRAIRDHSQAPLNDTDRTKRVKDAKNEAQTEIDEYRKQKEEEFKKFEAEQTSGNKKAEEDASKDAESQLREIEEAGKKSGDKVIEDLIRAVTDVKPEVPETAS